MVILLVRPGYAIGIAVSEYTLPLRSVANETEADVNLATSYDFLVYYLFLHLGPARLTP